MDILVVLVGLTFALMVSLWSCARSYFEKGRRKGLEQATLEMTKGVRSYVTDSSGQVPQSVLDCIASVKMIGSTGGRTIAYEDPLRTFGDIVGEACWQKGFEAGLKEDAKPADKIRLDVSVQELLHITWLAHLGFLHMMPNYRGFEIHRFNGADDARDGARSVAKFECALPKSARPFEDVKTQIDRRENLIDGWWAAA